MKIMGDLFRSIDWWKIIPDQSVFEKEVNGNVAARSSDGDWILAYLTSKVPVIVKLNKITADKSVTGWWMNPLTGERTKIGTYTNAEEVTLTFPQSWEDAVLLIK